jgi:hypothetical protein
MNTTQPEPNSENEEHEQESFFNRLWDFLGVVRQDAREQSKRTKFWIELIAVAGGIFYAVVTYCIFSDSHRNFIIDQRPWIVGQPSQIILVVGQPILQPSVVINTGKTPARDLNMFFKMEVVNSQDSPSFSYSSADSQNMKFSIMYPNEGHPVFLSVVQEVPGTHALTNLVLTQDLFDRYNNREIAFVIYAKIEYWDVFRVHHSGTWCGSSYNWGPNPSKSPPALQKCSEYNNADYD